jgi:hypothetical protein
MQRSAVFYRSCLITATVVLFFVFFAVLYSAYLWGSVYYYGFILLVPFLPFYFLTYKKMKIALLKEEIAVTWAKPLKRDRDFADLGKMAALFPVAEQKERLISEQTKEDLHFELLYSLVDRTFTTPGAQVLYNLLQRPQLSIKVLQERGEVIRTLESEKELREKIMLCLRTLGRQKTDTVTGLVWDEEIVPARLGIMPAVLASLALIALASIFLIGAKAVFFLLPVLAVNLYYSNQKENLHNLRLPAIHYLRSVVLTAGELAAICRKKLPAHSKRLRSASAACRQFVRRTAMLGLKGSDPFGLYDYLNILFLLDLRNYEAATVFILRRRSYLRQIYSLLGEIDALLSVASLRCGTSAWIEPQLLPGKSYIKTEEIYHPLLENPVANSIDLERPGVVLTGSNMSGKSTFLRTIAVNALFAQTVYTCFAKGYRGGLFNIVTSINKDDFLPGGKSFFLSEAEAILEMIRQQSEEVASLCVIDEIFRGTHSLERIPAAVELLRYLAKQNALCLIATHDLEIAKTCSELYATYHFSEQVGSAGLKFDYLLKPGLTTSWNAIRILEQLGYPREIVERASRAVNRKIKVSVKLL